MVLFTKVTNFGTQCGYCKKGIRFDYDTPEEYTHDFAEFMSAGIIPALYDNVYRYIVIDQKYLDAMRLHRGARGNKSGTFYWNKLTNRTVTEKMARFLACAQLFFTPEEKMP